MSILTSAERRAVAILRLIVIVGLVGALILVATSNGTLFFPVGPFALLGLLVEAYVLVKRITWTLRSPKEIARERRERRERAQD